MDNTELHYVTYDPDEIWEEMIENYVDAGGDILYPGDEKEMLLRSVQADIVQVFAGIDNALRMMTLRYATGEYLDIYGEQRGCERIQASAARAMVKITTNATGRTDTLPAGSSMTSDGQVYYELVEDLILTGYQQQVTVEVVADRTGPAGNGLLAGTQMQLSYSNAGIASIVATTNASGGNSEEDDETYRERIREYGITSVTTGTREQYEAKAKAASSAVVDAYAMHPSLGAAGEVHVYLILSVDTGQASIIQAVTDALSAETVRPLTDLVNVYEAEEIDYTLKVEYMAGSGGISSTDLAAAVAEYTEWQDEKIGRPFNPDRLKAALYNIGVTYVDWGAGSEFNGSSDIEYTPISEIKRCKGTITLEEVSSV